MLKAPLAHREAPQGLSIELREITDRGMIDLRGLATDKKFMAAAKKVLGLDLPKAPRTSVSWGDVKALWLSIDQWLILCSRAKAAELTAALKAELGSIHSLVVDVSDMRAVLRLEGEGVREVLLKGSSLDLLSDDYAAGHGAPHALCRNRGAAACCGRHCLRYLCLPLLRRLCLGLHPCNGPRACKSYLVWGAKHPHLRG